MCRKERFQMTEEKKRQGIAKHLRGALHSRGIAALDRNKRRSDAPESISSFNCTTCSRMRLGDNSHSNFSDAGLSLERVKAHIIRRCALQRHLSKIPLFPEQSTIVPAPVPAAVQLATPRELSTFNCHGWSPRSRLAQCQWRRPALSSSPAAHCGRSPSVLALHLHHPLLPRSVHCLHLLRCSCAAPSLCLSAMTDVC